MNFWTGEACYVRGAKIGGFGSRLSQMRHRSVTLCMMRCCIKHVSRVGTHRSNEWEGRHGQLAVIHAARDKLANEKV
jgi:hypothetical protein